VNPAAPNIANAVDQIATIGSAILSILKPAGSVGVIVQLVSTLLELLKVILVMAEPVMAT
jgi:hypothetical protein